MKLLLTAPTGPDPKVKDSELYQYAASMTGDTRYNLIATYVKDSTRLRLLPVLGKTLHDALCDYSGSDEDILEVIDVLRSALGKYSLYTAIPHVNGVISNSGIQQTNNDKTARINQWSYKSMRWNLIYQAEGLLDQAIHTMTDSDDTIFDDLPSTSRTLLFASAEDMGKYCRINNRRAYTAALPYIEQSEDDLADIMTATQLGDLLTTAPSATDTALLTMCKRYVASQAIALGAPSLSLYIDGNSIHYVQSADLDQSGVGVYSQANQSQIQMLIEQSRATANRYASRIKMHLCSNSDEYPLWKAAQPEDGPKSVITSECGGGVMWD